MTRVTGQAQVSGLASTRVPIRLEHPDGSLAGLTTAELDGAWVIDVAPGRYVVVDRTREPYTVHVADDAQEPATGKDDEAPAEAAAGASRAARRHAAARKATGHR